MATRTRLTASAGRWRAGPGVSMKIQAKDCAQGGIFQMEPERVDGTRTRITHIRTRNGTFATVLRCGRYMQRDVASGGRMGWVTGGDALEVAPPSTDCVQNCQAQNRVRGRAVQLGFPFPVPAAARLQPSLP